MLDSSHGLVLRAVEGDPGTDHASPALDRLVQVGFVQRTDDRLVLTREGRTALEAGVPSRTERWALRLFAASVTFLALGSLLERLL